MHRLGYQHTIVRSRGRKALIFGVDDRRAVGNPMSGILRRETRFSSAGFWGMQGYSWSANQRSASMAAWQPIPAAVMAWR